MLWHQAWELIAARIDALRAAGEYVATVLSRAPSDSFGIVRKWINGELLGIVGELESFKNKYQREIPPHATAVLDRVLTRDWFTSDPAQTNTNLVSIGALLTFRSAFEYVIRDAERELTDSVELAFEHLRRSLIIDKSIRDRWLVAYDTVRQGETACEKLGALHLLSHGILAFKISGAASATDLAFNEPVDRQSIAVKRAARGLVLTEWKIAGTEAEAKKAAKEAIKQANLYASGVLGATELTRTRYIVIVSKKDISQIPDFQDVSAKYRHIHLSLSGLGPSKASKVA